MGSAVRLHIADMQRTTRELGWELSLGTYWIPRIAIVLIAIAVTLLLSLAAQRWGAQWGPYIRVAVGYAVCAGLLVLARRVEKKSPPFARALDPGGVSRHVVLAIRHQVLFRPLPEFISNTMSR